MGKTVIAIKEPNKQIETVLTTGELEELQKIVGGYLEIFPFENGINCWCNEEGKLQNLEPNFGYYNDIIVGTVFFSREEDESGGLKSLTLDDIVYLRQLFGYEEMIEEC